MSSLVRRIWSRQFVAAVALIAVAACKSDDITSKSPELRDITVVVTPTTLVVGQTAAATANGIDQFNAVIATGTVTWSTSSSTVATVAPSGVVTAVGPGVTSVTASVSSSKGTITKSAELTVSAIALTTLTATAPSLTIVPGQTVTATVAGVDQVGRAMTPTGVTWASATPAVATVSPAGLITALTPGTSQITASSAGKTAQLAITVNASPAIRVNEVESNGGTPGDWIELINTTTAAVDVSGWGVRDNDSTHVIYKFPAGTIIPAGGYLVAEEAQFGFGLGAADDARLYNQYGVIVDAYAWTAHASTTYGRCVNGTGTFVTNNESTKGAANDCRVLVKINEVESNGGTPGDWIELYNAGAATVNLAGYVVKDNDDTHSTVFAAGTTIAPGAFLVVEEATMGYGLGAADAARLFDPAGALVDSYTWTAHATVTYGRCPDGTGSFADNSASTKGAANTCGAPTPPTVMTWPGSDDVQTVDGVGVFQTNGSGLTYEGAAGAAPAVLWAVRNGPGTLFRMIFSGGIWTPDPNNGWNAGKQLKYTDGTGNPDSEGVTFASGGSAGGVYVATERNNDASATSRNVILRVVPSNTGTTLTATHQWDITADLPVVGANLGIEAITWIPDSMLVANGFLDEAKARAYAPADYADHAGGLFLVGVEGNGSIYAYALNHTNGTFTRVATIASGFTTTSATSSIMDLAYDRESGYLWGVCDDTCNGTVAIFEIDRATNSPTRGKFVSNRRYARPTTMPNINNEGFTFAPNSECVSGQKPVFWSDDNETGGHTIRKATIPCGTFAPLVQRARAVRR